VDYTTNCHTKAILRHGNAFEVSACPAVGKGSRTKGNGKDKNNYEKCDRLSSDIFSRNWFLLDSLMSTL